LVSSGKYFFDVLNDCAISGEIKLRNKAVAPFGFRITFKVDLVSDDIEIALVKNKIGSKQEQYDYQIFHYCSFYLVF
jgi:hypothetical protein